ncbi:ABC transporter substrate-binding protein [Nocardioides yefusunii]|uniref:ABC transporter substrate-binding protein n=1 Tax=Nocardioides yefusunii TaxID=2500546 RepID=A0ABW1QS57_9ACTN|nr:ABC transporter substrate-binding protein [Nocardioides yefusunii]
MTTNLAPATGISRRGVLSVAAGLGLALPASSVLTACGSDDAETVKGGVTRTYQSALGWLVGNSPEIIAKEAGYLAEYGINGKLVSSTGTAQALQGLLAKSSEYSRIQPLSSMITIANEDAPFVVFGTSVQASAFEMQSLAEKPVKSMKDLEGKSVGIISAGGTTDQMVDLMAVRQGVKPKDINRKVTGLGTAAHQFALKGDVVAWIGSATERTALEEAGHKIHAWSFDSVIKVPGDSFVTTRDELDKNRDVVVKVLAAYYRGLEFVVDPKNDKQTIEYFRTYNREITVDMAQAQLDVARPLFLAAGRNNIMKTDVTQWDTMQDALAQAGLIEKTVDLSTVVYADLLDEALALI